MKTLLLIAFVGLAACAQPTIRLPEIYTDEVLTETVRQLRPHFRKKMDQRSRLQRIAQPLLWKNTNYCGQHTARRFGFYYLDQKLVQTTPPEQVQLIAEYYGLERIRVLPTVLEVAAESPAAQAGIRPGDVITHINGKEIKTKRYQDNFASTRNKTVYAWKSNADKLISQAVKQASSSAAFTILRDNTSTAMTLPAMQATLTCKPNVILIENNAVNAYTDGKNIAITTGMLEFATDEELALVIAHELAHIVLHHVDSKRTNAVLGGIVGGIAGAMVDGALGTYGTSEAAMQAGMVSGQKAYSQEFEKEADYIGLYMLAQAGYPTAHAANFWRRMGDTYPQNIQGHFSATHPSTAARYLLLKKTHQEIEVLRASKRTFPSGSAIPRRN